MEKEHTAGPWMVVSDESGIQIETKEDVICHICSDGQSEKADYADAELIAASPDLLDACEAFIAFDNDGSLAARERAVALAKKAIEKATT